MMNIEVEEKSREYDKINNEINITLEFYLESVDRDIELYGDKVEEINVCLDDYGIFGENDYIEKLNNHPHKLYEFLSKLDINAQNTLKTLLGK